MAGLWVSDYDKTARAEPAEVRTPTWPRCLKPMRRTITGFSNPTVKFLRSLRDKKHRRRERRFLAEGLRLLTDARESGRLPEMLVMATGREPHPLLAALEHEVAAAGGEIVEMDEDILAKVTGKENPQAVAGVFAEFDTRLASLDRTASPIWLVAQALRDPGNLGTMLRTGDAVGAGGLILIDDCADPFSVEAVRASMGAIFTQRLAQARWDEFIGWLRAGDDGPGGQLVAASLRDAQDYRTAPYAAPCFLMVGNESRGLPAEYEDACDLRVTMPMLGRADSLNAAVAGAVLAYEALAHLRQR
jgi:TrmH family RNA methyltransferase